LPPLRLAAVGTATPPRCTPSSLPRQGSPPAPMVTTGWNAARTAATPRNPRSWPPRRRRRRRRSARRSTRDPAPRVPAPRDPAPAPPRERHADDRHDGPQARYRQRPRQARLARGAHEHEEHPEAGGGPGPVPHREPDPATRRAARGPGTRTAHCACAGPSSRLGRMERRRLVTRVPCELDGGATTWSSPIRAAGPSTGRHRTWRHGRGPPSRAPAPTRSRPR